MNDIDIEEGRAKFDRRAVSRGALSNWHMWTEDNAAAMFDAIETGRQWETIARRLAECLSHWYAEDTETGDAERWPEDEDALAAFRDVADRTPTPHHDGGAG